RRGPGHHPRDLPPQADGGSPEHQPPAGLMNFTHVVWLAVALPLAGFLVNGALALWRPNAKSAVSVVGAGVLVAAVVVSAGGVVGRGGCVPRPLPPVGGGAGRGPAVALAPGGQAAGGYRVPGGSALHSHAPHRDGGGEPDPPVQRGVHARGSGLRPLLLVPQ